MPEYTATVPEVEASGEEAIEAELDAIQDETSQAAGASEVRFQGVRALTRKLTEPSPHSSKKPSKACLTPNIKALILSAFLFAFITVVQVFAAIAAHSQALLMDCISMGVDAITYMGNIAVELRKRDGSDHKGTQLIACAISLACLLYFTYDAMQESWGTVRVCQGWDKPDGDEDDVNGYITLAFAAGGLVFDSICLLAFYRSNKINGEARHVNMFTALLHVGADCMRSTSTMVMSLLILLGHVDSTCADAYTSMIIGVTIIGGGLAGIYSWVMLLYAKFCAKQPSNTSNQSEESSAESD